MVSEEGQSGSWHHQCIGSFGEAASQTGRSDAQRAKAHPREQIRWCAGERHCRIYEESQCEQINMFEEVFNIYSVTNYD